MTCFEEIKMLKTQLDGAKKAHYPQSDSVNHPSHYNQGKIEVIEFIEDKKLGFHLGNAVKYISRAGKKDADKFHEDLEKAIWYIKRAMALTQENCPRPNDMNKGV